jgi:ribose transport system ATP-binding protein
MKPPLLVATGIGKRFPGVKALQGVNLLVHHGEVLAVLGENGAGKSTLMKILAGLQQSDEGTLEWQGSEVCFSSAVAAMQAGIVLIHQELNLSENLSAAANVFLGREPQRWGFVQKKSMEQQAQVLLDRLGFGLPSHSPVAALSPGKKQIIEIAKALATDARLLIMDEPTASLSQAEADLLFAVIHRLKSEGVSVIYISHRLQEIERVADRVTVLRDGENAGELAREEIQHDAMVRLMVGRAMSDFYQHQSHPRGAELLRVQSLRTRAHPRHSLDFCLHAGEIVGVAGLVGAGRTEMLEALAAIVPPAAGRMWLNKATYQPKNPREAIAQGVMLVPEDRKHHGLVLEFSVQDNLTLPSLESQARGAVFRDFRAERSLADKQRENLQIKASHGGQVARLLSGGNQQKIVIGKWLARQPKVLLLDEPTRGIDVGAKREIYQWMEKLVSEGIGVLFVSSDLEEILGVADRVLVMHEGRLAGELTRDAMTEESIMHLATGAASEDLISRSS